MYEMVGFLAHLLIKDELCSFNYAYNKRCSSVNDLRNIINDDSGYILSRRVMIIIETVE